jgi:thiol-disulfide isomerase/thioredoxin
MSGVEAFHFWSPTCTPCITIKPAIDDLKEEFPTVKWTSTNTHIDLNGLGKKMGIQVVPTIVVTKNGVEVGRHSGTNMIVYYTLLKKALAA